MSSDQLKIKVDKMYWPYIGPDAQQESLADPLKLLTWNRFDLAVKLAYLDNSGGAINPYLHVYKEHIRSFSLGSFKEPGNDEKNTLEAYIKDFESIHGYMKEHGFDETLSLVPVSTDGSLINGAHRTSAAIALGKRLSVLRLPIAPSIYDWKFFRGRGMPEPLLDMAAVEFVRRAENVYIALLWPRSAAVHAQMLSLFERVVYEKTIPLSLRGAHNLLSICYRGEPWLGTREKDFPGVKGKLVEVYRDNAPLRIVAFQADSLGDVLALKDKLRSFMDCEKHSVHITDTQAEAKELAPLLFNENGVHFLNFANPNKYEEIEKRLFGVREFLDKNKIAEKDFLIDSSLLLELYGLRRANDIDFLLGSQSLGREPLLPSEGINPHDEDLEYHGKEKDLLVYDPTFHFVYEGLKFLSFSQLYTFKKNRGEEKDGLDIRLMSSLVDNRYVSRQISRARSKVFFAREKGRAYAFQFIFWLIKALRIYEPLRNVKRRHFN